MNELPLGFRPPLVDCDAASIARRVRVALGKEPADVLIAGGQVVNVFTETIEQADVAIVGQSIAAVGNFGIEAPVRVDAAGKFVLPGLIDAHMHLESTLLLPRELARMVVPHGTAVIVADPHEIANVHGLAGIELLMAASANLPVSIYFMASSCVPATPCEHAGAQLDPASIATLLRHPQVLGLAEMMNFPGVWSCDAEVIAKVSLAAGGGFAIDGHAPRVVGQALAGYAAAGIRSDHESVALDEAIEKAKQGMLVQVREGSSARNLDAMLPGLVAGQLGDWCLATDDIHPDDILAHGHIDGLLRRVVRAGVPAATAVRHASLVPARHYGLRQHGAVAPAYRADLLVVGDLIDFQANFVVHGGQLVAREGRLAVELPRTTRNPANSVAIAELPVNAFEVPIGAGPMSVVGIVPGQIVTRHLKRQVVPAGDKWMFDPNIDLAILACVERHRRLASVGVGLVSGFGFRSHGAIGSTVAHDSHNIVLAGTNDADLRACTEALAEMGGGFVVAIGGIIVASLPLPVAGLISLTDGIAVAKQLDDVRAAARSLGCWLPCPFGTLSFLALPVIPELKITDQGLFDVTTQQFVH